MVGDNSAVFVCLQAQKLRAAKAGDVGPAGSDGYRVVPTETTGDQALAIDAFKGWRGSESQAAAQTRVLEDKMFVSQDQRDSVTVGFGG